MARTVTLHWREHPDWQRINAARQHDLPQQFVVESNLDRDPQMNLDGPVLILPYEDWQALGGPITLVVTLEPGQ